MQSITVPSVLSPKPHILPTTATCTLVGWPSLHTRRLTLRSQVIYKSLLGKAPPYLSSLVTIAAPTRSTRSSRYISQVIPQKPIPPLATFPYSSLLPMTGTNYKKKIIEADLISPVLTLSTSCQRFSQITAHSPLSMYLAPLHPGISTCTSVTPVFNWYFIISHHGLFIVLPPLSYLICTHCI
jgi:hypothetical protein